MAGQYVWKIGGEAGFGINTTGLLMDKIITRSGYHFFDYLEYPSLIRGGHNTYEVVIDEKYAAASKREVDMLVCLNKETYVLHKQRLHEGSLILHDATMFAPDADGKGTAIAIPIREILLAEKAQIVVANMIMLGATVALLGVDEEVIKNLITETFKRKGDEVVAFNLRMMQKGKDVIEEKYATLKSDILKKREGQPPLLVMSGNEAFSLAAIAADCRLFAAYPMTPASTVLTYLAATAEKSGMVVRHSEDEIAVINTALGAAFGGVRASVGTSGGGFALMVESLSYAGVAEIPVVVFLSQRPGPATGLPTWTEQGDLLFAVHGGHGDFPKIVLAPGDQKEMLEQTLLAFDLADIYQTPVILMSDKLLSEGRQDVDATWWEKLAAEYKPNRGKINAELPTDKPYRRFEPTEDGISPMLIPGTPGTFYQANSYEHFADGHTTEDMKVRIEQADKRQRKMDTYLAKHFQPPVVFGDLDAAEIVFVSWGANKGAIMEAMTILEAEGKKVAFIHFTYIFPLDKKKLEPFVKRDKRYILIENNQSAQFGRLLRQETGYDIEEKILKYDGQPIFKEEIVEYIKGH